MSNFRQYLSELILDDSNRIVTDSFVIKKSNSYIKFLRPYWNWPEGMMDNEPEFNEEEYNQKVADGVNRVNNATKGMIVDYKVFYEDDYFCYEMKKIDGKDPREFASEFPNWTAWRNWIAISVILCYKKTKPFCIEDYNLSNLLVNQKKEINFIDWDPVIMGRTFQHLEPRERIYWNLNSHFVKLHSTPYDKNIFDDLWLKHST